MGVLSPTFENKSSETNVEGPPAESPAAAGSPVGRSPAQRIRGSGSFTDRAGLLLLSEPAAPSSRSRKGRGGCVPRSEQRPRGVGSCISPGTLVYVHRWSGRPLTFAVAVPLQINAVSLYLLYLVEMISSGLQIVYNTDEVRCPRAAIARSLGRSVCYFLRLVFSFIELEYS